MAGGSTRARKQASADRPGAADPTAPLDGGELLTAARPVLSLLRTDLEERASDPGVTRALEARYEDEKQHKLTGDSFAAWREARIAQIAASWFLSCVFVRTLEDRGLLGQARLASPGAMDSQAMFFQLAPSLTERDYLLFVFRELAELPASRALFDREHALVWQLSPSAAAAKELLRLFRAPSAETPAFRFGQTKTQFLGDLYQDLYEDVRKRFALLQTPDFILRFILDRTLEPAIARFGLDETTLIDPTCGSGHFLLGAFDRLFEHRLHQTPGIDVKLAAQRALDAVFGADINPYAVAIARMRLTLAFLEKAGIQKLKDAPAPRLHLAVADSLLYNPQHAQLELAHREGQVAKEWHGEAFALEDEAAARDVLHRQYTAVVGNPPFIAVQDPTLRDRYRAMYASAGGKYTLSTVFTERFFQLSLPRGYVGLLNSNAFLKRNFGSSLIEEVLPKFNLELIVNTAWVPIPGPSIQTVMLFGTAESPKADRVRCVLARKGERAVPTNPADSLVWQSIALHFSDLGFEDEYITVADISREELNKHPWSLAGGAAAEIIELLQTHKRCRLSEVASSIGITCVTGDDEIFLLPEDVAIRLQVGRTRGIVTGELVRDWGVMLAGCVLFPYNEEYEVLPPDELVRELRYLWPYRHVISRRRRFGVPILERGMRWYELQELYGDKLRMQSLVAFAEVATGNHFILVRDPVLFKQTSPVVALPSSLNEDEQFALVAHLNSSTASYWLKQNAHQFGTATHDVYTEHGRPESNRYSFSATVVSDVPVPNLSSADVATLAALARRLQHLASEWDIKRCARKYVSGLSERSRRRADDAALLKQEWRSARLEMVALQEEIDWIVYEAFGLAKRFGDGTAVRVDEAERPSLSSREELPEVWRLRREQIRENRLLAEIEGLAYKRAWTGRRGIFGHSASTLDDEVLAAIGDRELDAVEACLASSSTVVDARTLSRHLESTCDMEWAIKARAQWSTTSDIVPSTVAELIRSKACSNPFLSQYYMTETGLDLMREWELHWRKQWSDEQAGVNSVLEPPRGYSQKDYQESGYWNLRGSLGVPRERLISYPGCESDQDGEPMYGWAGWNHLQRAQALAALYQKRKTEEGWTADRLTPMLAGLLELLPWIQQWHNDLDADYGLRMGDYFAQFLDGELATLGLTRAQLEAWRPTKRASRSKVAAAAGEASSGEGNASSLKRPRRARQQASEPPTTASPEASSGHQPVRKHSSLPAWGSDILGEVASRTGLGTRAGSWATSLRGESLGTTVLAAVLRQQTEPSSREQVERAVVLALLPLLMQPHFASASRWKSVIGKNDLGIDSVTSLAIPWNAVIRSAIQQKVLVEDPNGRWSAGPDIDDVPASALDARALVALAWIASVPAEDAAVTQALEELRAVA